MIWKTTVKILKQIGVRRFARFSCVSRETNFKWQLLIRSLKSCRSYRLICNSGFISLVFWARHILSAASGRVRDGFPTQLVMSRARGVSLALSTSSESPLEERGRAGREKRALVDKTAQPGGKPRALEEMVYGLRRRTALSARSRLRQYFSQETRSSLARENRGENPRNVAHISLPLEPRSGIRAESAKFPRANAWPTASLN